MEGLRAWTANIGIQPVLNHHKAVNICVYFSKVEREISEAMRQATRKAFISEKSAINETFAKTCTSKREYSVQEAVSLLMPELWLQKVFSTVFFKTFSHQ